MDYLFHQNMRVFGGDAAARNQAYEVAFAQLRPTLGAASNVPIGGFTEIVNNTTATATMQMLAGRMGLTTVYLIACGKTALAKGPEYVAVGASAATPILAAGRIAIDASHNKITLIHDPAPALPPPPGWCKTLPPGATLDYRGVVYLIANVGGTAIAVGFLHNMYTDPNTRTLIAEQIPHFGALMAAEPTMAGGPVYIGGDFNVLPIPRSLPAYGLYTPYAIGIPALPPPPHPIKPGGTTAAGNLYDYWYSDRAPAEPWPPGFVSPVAGVYTPTLFYPDMSDHCGVVLRIR
ncbi:MAG TPA: hypothetical protein VK756_03880 [Solirubrobacteraceae bacterium]|jgi:hypothetical protein|nr:hypothetical protein [Solirubrobacteraceae bacterium]